VEVLSFLGVRAGGTTAGLFIGSEVIISGATGDTYFNSTFVGYASFYRQQRRNP
jgi:cyanophycinase-like exopeptidase